MSDLQSIAKQKVEAAVRRHIAALPGEIEAIKREHAAKGLLKSGATLKRVLAICKSITEAQGTTVIKEYRWAIDHALLVSQSWVEQLVTEATGSLAPLHLELEKRIRLISAFTGMPELASRLLSELELVEKAVENDIAIALRAGFAERRRGLIRGIAGFVPRLLSRLLKGGT